MKRNHKYWQTVFENELIKLEGEQGVQKYGDDIVNALAKSGDYLPRLQLMTSNAAMCKDGKFPINHYAIVDGQTFKDMGETIDVLVINWRPKALSTNDPIMAVYDVTNKEFTRICEQSETKDSGCMFGPEYLCWVPTTKEFVTFFMGGKISRRESPNLKALLKKAATLKAQKIDTGKYTYFSPIVVPCSTPFELPEMEDIMEQVTKFNNPPATEIEKVEKPAGEEQRAR